MSSFFAKPTSPGSRIQDCALECSVQYLVENKQYDEALQLINIARFDSTPEMLVAAATCQLRKAKPDLERALEILCHATKLGWNLPEILLLKGRCLFKAQEYERALAAFREANDIVSDAPTRLLIVQCEAHLAVEKDPNSKNIIVFGNVQPATAHRYQWYQSTLQITLTVYAQHLEPDQLKVKFSETRVDIEILQKEPSVLKFRIDKPIIPDQSKVTITPSKVEVKMMKAVPGMQGWALSEEV
jgi:tetratricopeptide (TPR) repeat protein